MASKRLKGCMHVIKGDIIHGHDSVSQLRQSARNGSCTGHGEGQFRIATVNTSAKDKGHLGRRW
jgi:hypothetical protein